MIFVLCQTIFSFRSGFCARRRGVGQEKPRVLVLTGISNEPDDEESFVRFLIYAHEFDVEGLVATASTWLKTKPREDLIRRDIAAYAEVRTNLLKHAPGFPPPPPAEQLLAVTKTGQTGYGMNFVGTGKVPAARNSLLMLRTKTIPARFG